MITKPHGAVQSQCSSSLGSFTLTLRAVCLKAEWHRSLKPQTSPAACHVPRPCTARFCMPYTIEVVSGLGNSTARSVETAMTMVSAQTSSAMGTVKPLKPSSNSRRFKLFDVCTAADDIGSRRRCDERVLGACARAG